MALGLILSLFASWNPRQPEISDLIVRHGLRGRAVSRKRACSELLCSC